MSNLETRTTGDLWGKWTRHSVRSSSPVFSSSPQVEEAYSTPCGSRGISSRHSAHHVCSGQSRCGSGHPPEHAWALPLPDSRLFYFLHTTVAPRHSCSYRVTWPPIINMQSLDNTRRRARKSRGKGMRTTTGCLTCRKRHKKCDERQPVCGSCSLSKRDCVYSAVASRNDVLPPTDRNDTARYSTVSEELSLIEGGISPIRERQRGTRSVSAPSNAIGLPSSQTVLSPSNSALPGHDPFSHNPGSHLARAVQILDDQNQVQYVYSPDTVASELLTADLASTRWLDLLVFDAAQADKGFSLAPTRHASPAEGVDNNLHDIYRPEVQATRLQLPVSSERAVGELPQTARAVQPSVDPAAESHAWQLDEDISLHDDEAVLFRTFAERAALWMDLFDPLRHFATHATRLALRNIGLMKAILALTSRHAIANAQSEAVDANIPIQYYYETLHYVQESLQYTSYTRSEELLATVIIISTYEMLDDSSSNWKRHLRGVFWIQRSQDVHGASGGLRQAVWWTWLRQDLWAAFREKRACFSFWKPLTDASELTQDQLANRAIYLLSQAVNYCAHSESPAVAKEQAGEALLAALERWHTFLGPCYRPLPCAPVPNSPFKPIWIHPPQFAAAMQAYNFAKILVTLHSPAVAGFQGYLQTQRILSEAVDSICGIAMELKDEGSQILSAQCLFGAGLCTQDPAKRDTIISLIKKCEERTAWPMPTLIIDLLAEWAKYS